MLGSNKITELWEVKPEEVMHGPSLMARKNRAKQAVFQEYVLQHQINGRWVTLSEIDGMEMQVGIRPWEGPGKPWVDLQDPDKRPNGEYHV